MAPKKRPPIERFTEKTHALGNGCVEWIACRDKGGYGRFYSSGRLALAHRWSYEYYVGPIPDWLQVDHACRNRSCVNPDHLRLLTGHENVLIGIGPSAINARKNRCHNGHLFDEQNTYVTPDGRRNCKECRTAAKQAHRTRLARRKAA